VDWDGRYILGNLQNETLSEIWNGDKAKALRREHVKGNFQNIPLCAKCTLAADSDVAKIAAKPFSITFFKTAFSVLKEFVWR